MRHLFFIDHHATTLERATFCIFHGKFEIKMYFLYAMKYLNILNKFS